MNANTKEIQKIWMQAGKILAAYGQTLEKSVQRAHMINTDKYFRLNRPSLGGNSYEDTYIAAEYDEDTLYITFSDDYSRKRRMDFKFRNVNGKAQLFMEASGKEHRVESMVMFQDILKKFCSRSMPA